MTTCKDCKYRKVYYIGTENRPAFSEVCIWTLKRDMADDDTCEHATPKEEQQCSDIC